MPRRKGSGNLPKVRPKSSVPKMPELIPTDGNDEPTVTQKVAAFNLEINKLYIRAYQYKDYPEVLEECFQNYLLLCAKYNLKITNTAAYTAIGMSKADMYNLRHGKRRSSDPRYMELVTMIDTMCALTREQYMAEGEINPAIGIWGQKNWDGFEEMPQRLGEMTNVAERKTAEQVKEEFKYLIGQDDPE